jgi:hypothetical protein
MNELLFWSVLNKWCPLSHKDIHSSKKNTRSDSVSENTGVGVTGGEEEDLIPPG